MIDNSKFLQVRNVLALLRSESAACPRTDECIEALMHKYDMLFLGENFNVIYTDELRRSMEKYFDISVSREDLVEMTPSLCKSLDMTYEAFCNASDETRKISVYSVKLF